MTTVNELITEVREYLDEPTSVTAKLFSDTEILRHIVRSINDLCSDTDINYSVYSYTVTGTPTSLTISTITAAAETRILMLDSLSIKQVDDIYYKDLKRVAPDLQKNTVIASLDIPTCMYYKGTFYFNEALAAGDIILLSGRFLDTSITSSSLLSTVYPFDTFCEDATVARTMSLCNVKKGAMDAAKVWMDLYVSRKEDIAKYYKSLVNANYPSAISSIKSLDILDGGIQVITVP